MAHQERPGESDVGDLLARAHEGLRLHVVGEHDRARAQLTELWEELGTRGHPIVRCSVAHYLADLQRSDTRSSLRWNRLSVREADRIADPMAVDPDLGVRGAALYPSLWLNVADDHRLLGEFDAADSALQAAREALTRLGSAEWPPGVGDALDDLARRLAEDRKVQPPNDHTEYLH